MKKLVFVFGTRPEFIKLYPIIKEAQKMATVYTINTGQHKEMLNDLFKEFLFEPTFDLEIMDKCNGLVDVMNNSLNGISEKILDIKPDIVLVHGDTSATFAGALAAFYQQVPVAHIEAGLRTNNIYSPFPEEVNRQLVGIITKFHFTPTEDTKNNLLKEGKNPDDIYVVGNSAIDMMKYTIKDDFKFDKVDIQGKKIILITVHRRENLKVLEGVFKAINTIGETYGDEYILIYPIHMNPIIREKAKKYITSEHVHIIDPLGPTEFHNLLNVSHLILTDSGGIQEEAPSLGKPVLVLRDTTERPEGVKAGTLKLVGTNYDDIVNSTNEILNNKELYNQMSTTKNPYGDGTTTAQIMKIIGDYESI